MSSPKTPTAREAVVTTMPPGSGNAVLVHEMTGSVIVGPNLHMALSSIRPVFAQDASGKVSMTLSKVPSLEVVMPLAGLTDMLNQLRQVEDSQKLHKMVGPNGSPSLN